MLGRQKGDAEEKALLAMETATEATTLAQSQEATLTELAEAYRRIRAVHKKRHAALTAELEALTVQRATAAAPVPPALLARYEPIRVRKGGVGAAQIQADNTCGACHIKLNATLVDAVRTPEESQICEYCGRILVPLTVAA